MPYKDIEKRRAAGMKAYWKRKELRWPELLSKSRVSNRKYYWRHSFIRLIQNMKKNDKDIVSITAWDLWKIAKKQKLVCPLTGRRLTNKTMSIDHIIPKSKGGKTIVDNLRLVDVSVNYAKHKLTDSEFISLCEEVVKHHTITLT